MPSASTKLEKQASVEVLEPMKQILSVVEKKVRNLEKRKAKLDAYKSDSQEGKELNEDQKKAVEKYDQVVEVLDFAKDMQKSFASIFQETAKLQKKLAKREFLERQQHELQRIKEIVMVQEILNSMGGDDVRNDFLNAKDGAVKLAEEELNSLDELYKLICPERDPESQDSSEFDKQLATAAEHLQSLLDSRNKEVIGTTYKALKDTIMKIHSCSYFNKSAVVAASTSSEPENESISVDALETKESATDCYSEEETQKFSYHPVADVKSPSDETVVPQQGHTGSDCSYFQSESVPSYQDQSHPLQEVLPTHGNLNFLQESQIDLEGNFVVAKENTSSVLDQRVVAPHSVAAASIGYHPNFVSVAQTSVSQGMVSPRFQQRPKEETALSNHPSTQVLSNMVTSASVQQQSNLSLPTQNSTVATPADFDPNQPIPTQTYTNQSFSSIHPLMATAGVAVPQSYVPVTLAYAMQAQHVLPTNIIAQPVDARGVATSSATAVLDPSVLPSSIHNQSSGLSTPSSVSKMSLNAHDAKEHFNRDFHMPQVSRETTHLGHSATGSCNSQYERINAHEAYQATSTSQSYMCGDNFSSESSSYSSNLKRGLQQRGVARGGNAARGGTSVSRGNRGAYRN